MAIPSSRHDSIGSVYDDRYSCLQSRPLYSTHHYSLIIYPEIIKLYFHSYFSSPSAHSISHAFSATRETYTSQVNQIRKSRRVTVPLEHDEIEPCDHFECIAHLEMDQLLTHREEHVRTGKRYELHQTTLKVHSNLPNHLQNPIDREKLQLT